MIIVSLALWWYSTGWITLVRKCGNRIQGVLGFFSVPLLLKSLFAPFRQISAERVQGPLNAQLRALGDKLFSRVIGAVVRSMLIVIGLASVTVFAGAAAIIIAVWPLLPFAPLVGFILMGMGI